ncbi:mitochondrial protein import protein MAS5 [Mytilinidion resinicola]|uniref:Mitochondrial protein import protein MAS5 n=1 Tax=Mytilinidion resinicola TaxID=574789 RepID=A0A6A6YGX5_9PEZI|nr:mitochondrial protein import protein MAS5 [Mytilinidion resinicola]KAF2808051.1 mitochondrial protein import protein MAS5 [Mytilinidion resinicola]
MLLRLALLLVCLLPVVLCAEDFYKLLGIEKIASEREIKKAYRRLSKQYHPDKNPGDSSAHDKFVAVADAYEVLVDEEQRRIYDQYGHEGIEQHKRGGGRPGQHHDPFDLFSRFFGGSGHFGHQHAERRGPNMEVRISMPLRDFYNGKSTQFTIEKQAICSECEGTGSADGEVETCNVCGGRGLVIRRQQLAPGLFQQVQSMCDACGGRGQKIKHPCPVCGGSKVVREPETHELNIEKGMPKGVRLTYDNEADESPDWVAGDLIVHLHEQPAELGTEEADKTDGTWFRRRGHDLFWREVLSLREAWMGDWTRNLTHLDGHIVQVSRKRGEVVQPNTVEVVKNEGMPIWHQELPDGVEEAFGSLHVEYVVVLPDQMEKSMEKEFWAVWEKGRKKKGKIDLHKDSGRPAHDEL